MDANGRDESSIYIDNSMFKQYVASAAGIDPTALFGNDERTNQRQVESRLKPYFDVSTRYVISKILLIIFPFKNKTWKRHQEIKPTAQSDTTAMQMDGKIDRNAPDLYIPLVAFGTFVLLKGIVGGLQGNFSPDTLGATATYSLLAMVVLVLFVKIVCYVFGMGGGVSSLDIAAVLGYNFVNTSLVSLFSIGGSRYIKNIFRLYICLSMSFFIIRSMLHTILPSESHLIISQSRKKKVYFLFGVVLLQTLFSFLLTR